MSINYREHNTSNVFLKTHFPIHKMSEHNPIDLSLSTSLYGLVPRYTSDLLTLYFSDRSQCSADFLALSVPQSRTKANGDAALSSYAPHCGAVSLSS